MRLVCPENSSPHRPYKPSGLVSRVSYARISSDCKRENRFYLEYEELQLIMSKHSVSLYLMNTYYPFKNRKQLLRFKVKVNDWLKFISKHSMCTYYVMFPKVEN